jgi:hypothetical protein
LTPAERLAGVKDVRYREFSDNSPARDILNRFVELVSRRMSRLMERASDPLSDVKIRREILRVVKSVVRRIFATRRFQRIEEQPDALTHQHVVDQYRIRGPNAFRNVSPLTTFRELALV